MLEAHCSKPTEMMSATAVGPPLRPYLTIQIGTYANWLFVPTAVAAFIVDLVELFYWLWCC